LIQIIYCMVMCREIIVLAAVDLGV